MKRITVFKSHCDSFGKIIALPEDIDLEELLHKVSEKLEVKIDRLVTKQGGVIDDVDIIRDEDVLYGFTNIETPDNELNKTGNCHFVTLNIGGKLFTTTRHTLVAKDPSSMLARMFDDISAGPSWTSRRDSTGAYLIDRSPNYFEPILNYLRYGQLILDKNMNPEGVLEEARFYGITSLYEQLEHIIEHEKPADDNTPFTRREFCMSLMSTPLNCELRCQGLAFNNADLSRLDLRYVNFKHATLINVDFTGANLSYSNFERADMSGAILNCANLLGAKLVCANLEGASMVNCNFEDPAGSCANMEGANLKHVNLEESQMASVNLRVANLRNANLKNCDLRSAVLAGADLENCNLSGCDLQKANLRGANLKGATFELMMNPLHMSQTIR